MSGYGAHLWSRAAGVITVQLFLGEVATGSVAAAVWPMCRVCR
jgi:hypothetical protein